MSPSLLTTPATLRPNPCLVSFAPASHFQAPAHPRPQATWCCLQCDPVGLPSVAWPKDGRLCKLISSVSPRGRPQEWEWGRRNSAPPAEWVVMTQGRGADVFATMWPGKPRQLVCSESRKWNRHEEGNKRGTRETHGTGFLIKAYTQGPVITLWVLWGNSVSFQ